MNKEEFDKISGQLSELSSLPNSELTNMMDKLSSEFDSVKEKIINLTYYLDKIELMYNNTLKEYQNRQNV